MFDDVHFEGTINLGAICLALIQLISAYAVLVRIRAMIEERNIKINLFPKKKKKPEDSPKVPQDTPPDELEE